MIQKVIFGVLFLLFPHLVRSQQHLGFVLTDGQSRVRLPIEICNNLIVVPVVLDGRIPLKFILDTGVRTSILTDKAISDYLHLSYGRKYVIAGPGGEKFIDAYVANNVTIDLPPGVHGEGHAMLVLDQDYLELRNYLGTDVHGILGYELFSRFIVQIDYEAKMLTLMLPDHFTPQRKFQRLNIAVKDTKPYLVAEIGMNDNSNFLATLLVDTGASHGLLLDLETDSTLTIPERHINSIIGRGLGGTITGQVARLTDIRLGKYLLSGPIVNFPDPNSYMDSLKNDKTIFRNGTIGGEILSRFTVIFDFPHEKMYLKRNANFKKDFHYNLSGLTIKAYGERLRNFEITDVRANSAASVSDLQPGDKIVSFNGELSSDLTLDRTDDILNSQPGRKVVLEIMRNGKKMKRDFVLKDSL